MIALPGTTERLSAKDGTVLAARSWPGTEPSLFFAHGNGFSKELWGPVVAALTAQGIHASGVALDLRGHGDSGAIDLPFDLRVLGSDVAETLAEFRRRGKIGERAIGIGHSSGATSVAMAAIDDPGVFDHLVLVEPIIFPPPYERMDTIPIAEIASRRRASFPDRETALSNFRGKGPFATWGENVLEAYVDGAMRATDDGLVLKCSPETEAEIYRVGLSHDTWDRLGSITRPVTLIVGAMSTTHRGSYLEALTARFGEARLDIVPEASHFVPMEVPGAVAAAIAAAIERVALHQ
ncbi:MAG: alpha/beta hydrolase [Acidimicrobiia bacterium]|nr:MAG: alpha/beta hydrolase [Acidimicrobiia bacterium]